ncbi:MAG: LysM peptidoglycan-binding domain-containing protein [bacterium]
MLLFLSNPLSAQEAIPDSDVYIVTRGDTLWNISEKFFGDPYFWPALWQINPHIKDPHWIYPGEIINLKKLTPPAYVSAPVSAPSKPQEKKEEAKPEEKKVVEEVVKPEKVAYATTQDKVDSCSFLIPQQVFHQREANEGWGKIIDSKENRISLSYMDHIFISLGEGKVTPGQEMTIFKIERDLKRNKKLDMPYYMIDILGKAKILEVHGDMSMAEITKSHSEAVVGDFVKPYEPMPRPLRKVPKIKDLDGEILEAEHSKENLSEYDIVFLNIGKWDGLEPGNPFQIYRFDEIKMAAKDKNPRKVIRSLGELIVIRTEEWTSTALITKSFYPIMIGDRVRIHPD